MVKTALIVIANGSEEIEAVVTADTLFRADIKVTIAGLNSDQLVNCSRLVKILPDQSLESVINNDYDAIILPGGLSGTEAFCKSDLIAKILKKQESQSKLIAAICAAPLALKAHGVCSNKKLTCYPCLEKELMKDSNFVYKHDRVVVDGNLITSRGPGTSFEFSKAIIEKLIGVDKAKQVLDEMLVKQ